MSTNQIPAHVRPLPILIVVALLMITLPSSLAQDRQVGESLPLTAEHDIVLIADKQYFPARVPPPPRRTGRFVQGVTFGVNWNPASCDGTVIAWPAEAQDAFVYTFDIWASLLDGTQPVAVDACWRTDLGATTLGSARSNGLIRDFTGAPQAGTYYPIALANQLYGGDVNGTQAEIIANFSASRSDWYLGTDGNPGDSEYDFVSVVLHEIGHGLGFSGRMTWDDGAGSAECDGTLGVGCLQFSPTYPKIYDHFAENGLGESLLVDFTDNTEELGNQLIGNNLYFDGANTRVANGGLPARLYAPATWQQGSSYSHLDEVYNNTTNALMTYSLSKAEANHYSGAVTMSILRDIGWAVQDGAELSIEKTVSASSFEPGDPLDYTLKVVNDGAVTMNGIVITDTVPTGTTLSPGSLSADAAYSGVDEGSVITWTTGTDLSTGQFLVRTFQVTTHGDLPPQSFVTNKAYASAANLAEKRASNTVVSRMDGATCGFLDDFESGSWSKYWSTHTTSEGRAFIGNHADVAYSDPLSIWLDDSSANGSYSESAIILDADLGGESDVALTFWWVNGYGNLEVQDGVFLSDDSGATWTKIWTYTTDTPETHKQAIIDLDAQAAEHGLAINNRLRIKIQSYNDASLWTEGHAIDDVGLACREANTCSAAGNGNWSDNGTWGNCGGGLPQSGDTARIPSGVTVNLDTDTPNLTIEIETSGTLATSASHSLGYSRVDVSGTFRVDPSGAVTEASFDYGTAGTLEFTGAGSPFELAEGHIFWPISNGPENLTISGSGGLDMNGVSRAVSGLFQTNGPATENGGLTVDGTLQLNPGGSVGSAPGYGSTATLRYSTGGNLGRAHEWSTTQPYDVHVNNGTNLDYYNGANVARTIGGSLTIDAGSGLNMGSVDQSLTVGGDVNLSGDLSLGSSIGGDLTLGGDWKLNSGASLDHNNRMVTLNGSALQTLGGTTATTFAHLAVDNSSGARLDQDQNVGEQLTLNSGLLDLAAYDLVLDADASISVSGPGAGKMIVADGNGALCKEFDASHPSFAYPIGDNSGTAEYSPVTLAFDTVNAWDTACVRLVNDKHPENNSQHYLNRYWVVESAGFDFDSCDATFTYVEADISGTEASMCGLLYRDSAWTMHDYVDGVANTFTVDTDGFSNFTGGANPLSVELLHFEAETRGGVVALEWETASEINTLGFNVYRSARDADGESVQLNDTLILTKQAPGSAAGSVYTWIDDSIQVGIDYFYVLEIVDSGSIARRYGPTHAVLVSEPLYRVLLPFVQK